MTDDPREYQTVEVEGRTMRACTWCTYVSALDGYPDHATWCEGEAMRTRAAQTSAAGPAPAPEEA